MVEAFLWGHGSTSLPSTGGCSSASPVDGFHTLILRLCYGRVFLLSGLLFVIQVVLKDELVVLGLLIRFLHASATLKLFFLFSLSLLLSLCVCPTTCFGVLDLRMWIWDWWLMWFVRFDAFGAPWFCVSDRTPCMCSGVGLLGTLFIQSKPLRSALSSVWYVSASFVDSSLTLRSLGEFL